jgi:hypothetical protein
MDESKPLPSIPISKDHAVRYRDGLIFALADFIPLRSKNLAALEIGRRLVREGDGWFVIIPGEETNTGTPIEFPVPELLESYLAIYLDIIGPRLLRHPTCSALWVNRKGDAQSVAAVIDDIVEGFENSVRQSVLPHELPDFLGR